MSSTSLPSSELCGAPVAPSRSTAYISNLPFSLTNTDIYKLFEKYGKLIRVTVMKDKDSRRSRGVAFLLYLNRSEAEACVAATHNTVMFGRTLSAHMAKDNGRAAQFVKRREYPDKTRCYECGDYGHLSYSCPKNLLGGREAPKKKNKKRKNQGDSYSFQQKKVKASLSSQDEDETFEDELEEDEETLSSAIRYAQELRASEAVLEGSEERHTQRRYKQSQYFSDEEELE